jgi:hypothetical protein
LVTFTTCIINNLQIIENAAILGKSDRNRDFMR